MVRALILIVSLLVTGCSSNEQASSGASTTKFCSEEKELGSHIKVNRCRSAKQIESEQRAAKEVLRSETVSSDN